MCVVFVVGVVGNVDGYFCVVGVVYFLCVV